MPLLSTQPQANDGEHVVEEHVAEERVEQDLIPILYWFSNPQVARTVTQSFRQHYRQAYLNWGKTPKHVKNQWFRAFMVLQPPFSSDPRDLHNGATGSSVSFTATV